MNSEGAGENPGTRAIATVEESILQRVAANDNAAMRACIDRYGGLVWSLARRFLSDASETEDAVHEIFVDLWKSAARFNPDVAAEHTFVAMIARRRLIDRVRATKASRREQPLSSDEPAPRVRPDPAEFGEDAAAAAEALGELELGQQRAIELAVVRGLSHEEIARITGQPLGTVKTHIRRGLIRLRAKLLERRSVGVAS
jgi:RNA polymerase sigma factor (sigma-70 family)